MAKCCCCAREEREIKVPYLGPEVPSSCVQGFNFVYELRASGRISSVEFNTLRNAIWPVKGGWESACYRTPNPVLQIKEEQAA